MNKIIQVQENALLNFSKAIQPGRPIGLFLHFEGVNAAATTAGLSSLGTAIVKRKGATTVNRRIETLARLIDIRMGKNLLTSVEAGAFSATVFIPFYEEGLPQSLNITGDSELVFEYQPGTGVGDFASLNLTAYSVEGFETEPERYNYLILGDDQSISGAVDKPYQLNDDNVSAVFVEDPDDVVSGIGFKNNRGQVFSKLPWDVLLGSTLIENRLETTDFEMVELQLFSRAEPMSYINTKNTIEIETSGAGTVKLTKCLIVPNERFYRDWVR